MSQTRFDYAEKEVADLRARVVASARRDALLEYGGCDVFAAAVGVHETQLSQSLNGKAERPWREEWTTALLSSRSVKRETKQRLANALLVSAGLVAAPEEEATVLAIAHEAIDEVASFGRHGGPKADELRNKLISAVAAGRYR